MSLASDAHFWDRTSRRYAKGTIADPAAYEHTLDRTRALLLPDDRVLELGCGTGTTAFRLAGDVRDYLATDFSTEMIAIARERYAVDLVPNLAFRSATAETLAAERGQFDAVLGFNYLHLVRDLPATLDNIHTLLASRGVFISKTPCVGDMNPLVRLLLLPAMRAVGLAPYAGTFSAAELSRHIVAAGFELLSAENHASASNDNRPYIVARKR
ncbi:class I SAM-dependent methyltransferase [Ensifer adhaerens]|jgi:ubiquinone/menaquinone biosynthesis C-methylase UbiE|uniref:class I SAM-dependent methyltransferase n=1 Tax=Ensifer adhaerens TaxID=106592 RepID=UPI000FDAD273|nr:class I SAM-dependent methyltransferase [Ensifer adhaerens]MDF8352767.1 class I SAM-dependent methyltransferase [Ensifer adhaerens]THA65862.1 class I SAM-dependent methyltransferase [Ensifer adhaerens]